MKSRNINEKGFSLIEVVVALFILSISVITIYNLIISTSVSTFQLEQNAFTQSINLTFTSLLIYTHSKSTF